MLESYVDVLELLTGYDGASIAAEVVAAEEDKTPPISDSSFDDIDGSQILKAVEPAVEQGDATPVSEPAYEPQPEPFLGDRSLVPERESELEPEPALVPQPVPRSESILDLAPKQEREAEPPAIEGTDITISIVSTMRRKSKKAKRKVIIHLNQPGPSV